MVRTLSVIVMGLLVVLPLAASIPALQLPAQLNVADWLVPTAQTLAVTLITSVLVIWLSLASARVISQRRWFNGLSVVLATPHVAFAVGVMFLFSPSGYLVRLLEAVSGWLPTPPAGWPLPEKSLLTLIIVLVLKEIPFLLLMITTQLQQLPYQRWLTQAQSLGWSASRGWWLLIVPALLRRLKLPLAAIIIYTLSVVDIPLLLAPNAPGLLATEVFEQHYQWANDNGAAVGVWLLLLCGAVLLLLNHCCLNGYQRAASVARATLAKRAARNPLRVGAAPVVIIVVLSLVVLLGLIAQSVAGSWFYPALGPAQWQPQRWLSEWPYLQPLLWNSLWLALACAVLAVVAAVMVLERQRQASDRQLQLLPLLLLFVPQLVLVLGWQRLAGPGSQGAVLLWSHVVFAFPYAYLVLHGSWVNFNERWLYQAQSLGYSYRRAWLRVLLPMLRGPLLVALAMAFSVSIAQYLPTLWLAGGTVPTLTTEAVSIASGGDWRLASVYALMQALLPLLVFTLVLLHNNKRRETDVTY